MDDIADLIEAISQDQQRERRIARVTVQPWMWQMLLGSAKEVWTAWHGFPESEMKKAPGESLPQMNIMGVEMEIDEMQAESYRLWGASGEAL